MVVSGTKWGWKRIAARLLLVPVLAGGAAGAAHAQNRAADRPPAGAAAGDPRALLKDGRKALADGRFNDAQDLARRAEANNTSGKWGLFDDTPASLLKDVQAAAGKAQKAEADQLVKQAKAMAAKPARTDAEKAQNLDAAIQMARRADQLHGPYSVWDLGDRPDKMAKDWEAARARLKVAPAQPFAATLPPAGGVRTAAGTSAPGSPSGVAAGTRTPPPMPARPTGLAPQTPAPAAAADPAKAAAVKLMAEGKQAADRGDFPAAKAKYTEAAQVGARFTEKEYNPGFALQELNARGAAAVDRLVKEAHARAANKDYPKADAALTAAGEIAAALSLFTRPIDQAKADLRAASGGKFGGPAPAGLSPAGGPETLVHLGPAPAAPAALPTVPSAPVSPAAPPTPGVAAVGGPTRPTTPAVPAAATGTVTGNELIAQATVELRRGDLEMARRLALQAHNQGAQAEAKGLLTQIDAEAFAAKQRTACKSYDAAVAAAKDNNHAHALQVLVLIDPKLLPADQAARRDELIAQCKAELDKPNAGAVTTAAAQPPMPADPTAPPASPTTAPGTAAVGDPKPASPDSAATQADAMRRVNFQKLRGEGLKVQSDAQAAFGRGETDLAITMLADYASRVKAAGLPPADTAMLLRPVDGRLEMFRVMKGQTDALTREKKEKREAREQIAGRGVAEENRKAEVQRYVRQYQALVKDGKYDEAERVALQAKQLDPDDPAIAALHHMAKVRHRQQMVERQKADKESLVFNGLYDAEKQGPLVTVDDPVRLRLEVAERARRRGTLDEVFLKTRTPKEFEIELKLDRPVSVEFSQTPLSQAVAEIEERTGLPITWDDRALDEEQVSRARPVTEKLNGYSARNALHLLLDKAGLGFVIEYESVRITTLKKAKGRLFTKVFSVADLVTPVPNFALPDYANFEKMLKGNSLSSGNVQLAGLTAPGSLAPGGAGLGGGTPLAGANLGTAPVAASGGAPLAGATLGTTPTVAPGTLATDNPKKHEALVRLITGMVRPHSWDGPHNGPGKIEYFDLGSALVVNQTADVIREVTDLLEALRRLQDLAVAVEVRMISLSETWFERMGVDFAMNVKTHNTSFEPQLTSRQFRPEPFLNDINVKGVTVGLQPAGAGSGAGVSPAFTPDLDVPFRSTSFNYAIPGFGGYPNNPGFNGGVSLGLAFLNDIQVFLFMEAAQGDRRVNVMQAPKLTLFNGQTATITISDLQFFVTSVTVVGVNGQIIFVPNNTPLPGPGQGALTVALQAVVSADRRFVRINLPVTLSAQSGATVPLFPVTTFIIPVFEGGSQGQPVPFTQFLQQPAFTTMTISTTVVCPDGGTVLLGGLKKLSEGRNEFGPPFLSKIPYLNRLFKNVGIGRETSHIMIMVTPRIIINAEEEIVQTEGGGLAGVRPGGP
jgi:Flp pilus assembly secretin CpaC/tetratricopeptide (TPR) repeat protein